MKIMTCLFLPLLVLATCVAAYAQLQVPGPDNTPKLGEKPPDFELLKGLGTQSGTLGMKDFAGKKKVLLAFYPADFTGG